MFYELPFTIANLKITAHSILKTWPIDKLEKFLEQAKKAHNDKEKIEKLFLEYFPRQLDFCDKIYIQSKSALQEKKEENPGGGFLDQANDKMILEVAGIFLDNTFIPIAKGLLDNKKNNKN